MTDARGEPAAAIDTWFASLAAVGRNDGVRRALEATLSTPERLRAAAYAPRRRAEFVAARGVLRSILAMLLDQRPHAIEIDALASGKPILPSGALHFNLAHSGDVLAIAVCRDRPVGIDVERIRPLAHGDALARRLLSPAEAARATCGDVNLRDRTALQAWTCDEALIKADGSGLRDVGSNGARQALMDDGWCVRSIQPAPQYVGAIAARSRGLQTTVRRCADVSPLLRVDVA